MQQVDRAVPAPAPQPAQRAQEAVTVVPAPPPPMPVRSLRAELGFDPMPLFAMLIIFVMSPIALAMSRFLWKRASPRPANPAGVSELAGRMERLEQAVDAVAIEVERIAESQRFVARLLAENAEHRKDKLPAGPRGTA